jgi:hypothetical protein
VVEVAGLPAGSTADVLVSSNAFSRSATGTISWTDVPTGQHTVTIKPVRTPNGTFAAAPLSAASFVVTVTSGSSPTMAAVTYSALPSALAVAVTGVPSGAEAPITVAAPGDDEPTMIGGTRVITSANAGRWRLTAGVLTAGGFRFSPSPAALDTTVLHGDTAKLSVAYAVSSGAIAVVLSGLPASLAGLATVSGPDGFVRVLTATSTVTGLIPGTYRVVSNAVTAGGVTFTPDADTLVVVVSASLVASPVTIRYAAQVGRVTVATAGVPPDTPLSLTLVGNGITRVLSGSATLDSLPVGRYTLTAAPLTVNAVRYAPALPTQTAVVTVGATTALAVGFVVVPTVVEVQVLGLPSGAAASITLIAPAGEAVSVPATTRIAPAPVGRWRLTADPVTSGGATYMPTPRTRDSVATAGDTLRLPVQYAVATGAIAVATAGLPPGLTPIFTLTGPGPSRAQSGAGLVSGVAAGTWTVTANTVSSGAATYAPSPASRIVSVTPNATTTATFSYTATTATNFAIGGVYLTQAIQKRDGSVTLVAGRDALLRVFAVASAANEARPDVRVRVYDGAALLQTATIPAPESSVRTTITEGTLASSWNLIVPGANIRPGTRVLVDLDPAQAISDPDRSDNRWPADGLPTPVRVATVPTFTVRFVPIVVGALAGNVTTANKGAFLSSAARLFPLRTITSDVRAPFTSSATEIQSNDGNGQWLTVLSEINALRVTDGAPAAMHYYGVLKVSYTSGVAGYGYVPGRAAIGWDYLPSGDRVAAHEWGHNFSRDHAPCGTSGDASYPYEGGIINHWGWNSLSNTLVSPTATDVMGYCDNQWISDYNWTAVMQYRSTSGRISSPVAPGDGLLVWGRVVNGQIRLEPAFRVNAPISTGATSASHRLELLDADGAALLDTPIATQRVDHATDTDERQFAVVVPWSSALEARLASIRVRDARSPLSAVIRSRPRLTAPVAGGTAIVPQPQAEVNRTTDGRARVTWNSADYPMAMVRDASTGALMGFVRRSGDAVVTGGRAIDVIFSDGVRSVQR